MQKRVWRKFSTVRTKLVGHGIVFRCLMKLAKEREEWVDLMLIEDCYSPSAYSIVVLSGSKAGSLLVRLPVEAKASGSYSSGIAIKWLRNNWKKEVCEAESRNIFYMRGFILASNWKKEPATYDNESKPWEKLLKPKVETLTYGAVFRCPGKWPYEEWVDFMLVADSNSPSTYSRLVVSGYKSGLIGGFLPKKAKSIDDRGISMAWLVENWKEWIYEKGPRRVFYLERFSVDPNWSLECVTEKFVSMNRDIKI